MKISRWTGPQTNMPKKISNISDELADVFVYGILMADAIGVAVNGRTASHNTDLVTGEFVAWVSD